MKHTNKIHTLAVTTSRRARKDCGQVVIFVMIGMSTFLLGFIGLGVDMTNLWLHRQATQNAADAACIAGAMDMLVNAEGLGPVGQFTAGTSFDCAATSAASPCQYAALNGYSSPGLTSGKDSNDVAVSFPSSIAGVAAPADGGTYPFMQVDVVDRVKVYFSSLIAVSQTQDVRARARCGLQGGVGPVPLIVLNPTEANTFNDNGSATVRIAGGPVRSIQVNSKNALAAYVGGSSKVDLSNGGPNFNGSSFGVWGGPNQPPAGFLSDSSAEWHAPAAPRPDPFKTLAPPPDPKFAGATKTVLGGVDGCPLAVTLTCVEYSPGDYNNGIKVQGATALFQPGVYYIKPGSISSVGLELGSNSLVRPTNPNALLTTAGVAGDGSKGTTFYFTGGATVQISANSGSVTALSWDSTLAHCPGDGGTFPSQLNIPAVVTGNVLVGPCTTNGTYEIPSTNVGKYRGMLFFQDRSAAAQAQLHGGGGLLLAGAQYFHDCPNSMTGNCNMPPTDYESSLGLWGGTGTGTSLYGQIVVDKLSLQGNSGISMDLLPVPFSGLTVNLLQ